MFSSIFNFKKKTKKIWDKWHIRLVILFSLFLQFVLIVFAPSRKRGRSSLVILIWLAYLLAGWIAVYCIGLISRNEAGQCSTTVNDSLVPFGGPFLLIHLGGPDAISAFALEDNELWPRHLVALIFQSISIAYVYFLTIHVHQLWLPTILTLFTGLIKYTERIHALYVAAIGNFRKSLLPDPDAGPNYAKLMEEHSSRREAGVPVKIAVITELRQRSGNAEQNDRVTTELRQRSDYVELNYRMFTELLQRSDNADQNDRANNEDHIVLVQKAFFFFHKFQGLIVDMIYSFKDRLDSQDYFKQKTAEEAFEVIEIELFMYELFYTKASAVRQHWFWSVGKLLSLILTIASLVLFIKAERHGFNTLDVGVTYALLCGALALLDAMDFVMSFFTEYTATPSDESLIDSYAASFCQKTQVRLFKYLNKIFLARFLRWRKPTWSKINKGPFEGCEKLSTKVSFRRWCGSISGYNLLKYCLDESVPSVPSNLHPSFYIAQVRGKFGI